MRHQRCQKIQRSRIRQGFHSTASPIHDKGVRHADPAFSILLMLVLVRFAVRVVLATWDEFQFQDFSVKRSLSLTTPM
jgi:hypothetical protein